MSKTKARATAPASTTTAIDPLSVIPTSATDPALRPMSFHELYESKQKLLSKQRALDERILLLRRRQEEHDGRMEDTSANDAALKEALEDRARVEGALEWCEGPGQKCVELHDAWQSLHELLPKRDRLAAEFESVLPDGAAKQFEMLRSELDKILRALRICLELELIALQLQFVSKVTGQPVGAPAAFLDREFDDRGAFSAFLLKAVEAMDPRNNPFTSQLDDARAKLAIAGRRLMKGHEYDALMEQKREQAKR